MNRSVDDLLASRRAHLAANLSVLYRQHPIHVVRGRGQYLYDDAGREYLDCMNNVPHIGHSHPAVTDAVTAQLALVNTNTRFLYDGLADYSERLAALFPDPLEVCFFVNSGSEANELALRLARAHTGRRGTVVLDGAYHGNTAATIDISPYKFARRGGAGRPDHVQIVPTPDPYRGIHRDAESASGYADEMRAAVSRAESAGHPAGAFVAESLMGTAGQIRPPDGWLADAYEIARAAGAVVVADEVQIGFGRVGTHLWAFDALGGQPDIVSLGKPIGNGFPLGAVVTTAEIAASFDNGMEYFNTFGGSPVACAVGLAVLDVIEQEGLQAHALDVGSYLADGFRALAERHAAIGDVRGAGLFLGVEFVRDRGSREPDTELAARLVSALRDDGILMSTDGPDDNVLKIKPPLPFDRVNADRVLTAIDGFLTKDV